VPLRLDSALRIRGSAHGAGGIGLFPGAIVALKGKNGGGGYFLATEVLSVSWKYDIWICNVTLDLWFRYHPSKLRRPAAEYWIPNKTQKWAMNLYPYVLFVGRTPLIQISTSNRGVHYCQF
jgi:hypothetical protein